MNFLCIQIRASIRQTVVTLILCLFFSQITTSVSGQNVDSLKWLLKDAKTIKRQFELNRLLTQSSEDKGGDKVVLQAAAEMVRLAILSKNDTLKQEAFFTYGHVCEDNTDFKGAITFFFKGLDMAEKLKDTINICFTLVNIGLVFKTLYNGPEALHYLNQAEKYLKSKIAADTFLPSSIYSKKSSVYLFMNKLDSARKYADKNRYAVARFYNPFTLSRMFSVYGDLYLKEGDLENAEKSYLRGIKVSDSVNLNLTRIISLNGYGEVLFRQKRYREAKAIAFYSMAVHKSTYVNQIGSFTMDITGLLSRIYKKLGLYDSAYYFAVLNKSYADSVFNYQHVGAIESLAFAQKVSGMEEQQKRKDQEAEENAQRQTLIRNGLIIGTLVLMVIFGLLFYQIRLKRKIEMERMRNRLSRDLHDDIGSTLSSINILSRVAQNTLEKDEKGKALESLEKINERTQRLLLNMSDLVWKMNPGNDSLEEVLSRMREYATALMEAKDIDYELQFPKNTHRITLKMEVKNNLYLIFKEAVNNLAKYSDCQKATLLLVLDNDRLRLEISDNGKGFMEESLSHKGGLINMKMRAEEMKAMLKITSESGKGTEVVLEMKV